jgi:hypothetical protein
MTWNYRIVQYAAGCGYGLHEVYYDDDREPWGMTKEPASFVCDLEDGPGGIKGSLLKARVDAINRPVFVEPKKGKWPGKDPGDKYKNFKLSGTR